jgi:hypothetical protein
MLWPPRPTCSVPKVDDRSAPTPDESLYSQPIRARPRDAPGMRRKPAATPGATGAIPPSLRRRNRPGGSSAAGVGSWPPRTGERLHVVDAEEYEGLSLPEILGRVQRHGYVSREHWAPHDIEVRDYSVGMARKDVAARLGGWPLIGAAARGCWRPWAPTRRCGMRRARYFATSPCTTGPVITAMPSARSPWATAIIPRCPSRWGRSTPTLPPTAPTAAGRL